MKRGIPPGTRPPSSHGAASRKSSMPPADEEPQIHCPIRLFESCEVRIRALTGSINEAQGAEKGALAQALLEEVEQLLDCKDFDNSNENCVICRNFSELRKNTAALVVKMTGAGGWNGGDGR
jgi:hypothetical protein